MPYIDTEKRVAISTGKYIPVYPGELNYLITSKLVQYIDTNGLSYETINDILGALEAAKLEFYRRIAVPYENTKMSLNGDVYD